MEITKPLSFDDWVFDLLQLSLQAIGSSGPLEVLKETLEGSEDDL